MPLRLDALTDKNTTEIFTWILQEALNNIDDAYAKQGKKCFLGSSKLYDGITKDIIGRYVFTFFINEQQKCNELKDIDIVLTNNYSSELHFTKRLPSISDGNEYYEVYTKDTEQRLIVETVNRYAADDIIEGTNQVVYASAFPFQLDVFKTVEEYNDFFGFKKSINVGNTGLTVDGLGTTFTATGPTLNSEKSDETLYTFMVGTVVLLREIEIEFGEIKRQAYLTVLNTALGELPTLIGKELFNTDNLSVGSIVAMNACVKANFVKDVYDKCEK